MIKMRFPPKNNPSWKWLYPDMGVKRWLLLFALGLLFLSLGASYVYVRVYRALESPPAISSIEMIYRCEFGEVA